MTCKCKHLNYIEPKQPSHATVKPKPPRKPPAPRNIIKVKLADNPKDIVIKFADKETLLKTLREILANID